MNEQQFLDALAKFAPAIRQAFIDAVQDITDNVTLARVVEALEAGDAEAAWRALGYQSSVFNRVIAQMTAAFEQGGVMMMASMNPPRDTTLRFDIRDRAAEEWIRTESSTLITGIEADMRAAVREAAFQGLAAGNNPRTTALDLVGRLNRDTGHREGGLVGLSGQGREWAAGAREKLLTLDESYFDMALRDKRFDRTVAAAIKAGKPLPAETVQKLVDRYKDNALRNRGELIARSETLAALNRSEYEAVRQSQVRLDLPRAAFTKIWHSAVDGRVRHSHRELNGMKVLFDEAFVSPVTGARMMHPHDTSLGAGPNETLACRCRTEYRTNFGYGLV